MRIKIDERLYAQAFDILGRAGEREFREISCDFPSVEGAQIYKLRFELMDKSCYELDITSGCAVVPYSLLANAGLVRAQFIAAAVNESGNYDIIAKSNVFYCTVGVSIGDDVEPIPTYEEAQQILDRILQAFGAYEAKSRILTEEQYSALGAYDSKTVYYVTGSGKVSAYLGDTLIAGGGSYDTPSTYIYKHKGNTDLFGEIEREE